MKKIIWFFSALIFLFFSQTAFAYEEAGSSAMLKNEILGIKKTDPRVTQLEAFLNNHRSPLAPYALDFIEAADQYQLDWKLVPAITGVESTFGKNIPFNSFNAYGWNNGAYAFSSWAQSIDHVSRVLREKYADRGLDTPEKIGPVYAPPSSTWPWKVNFFMAKIESFNDSEFDLTI